MITAEAKRRLKILDHWKKHGLSLAIDIFTRMTFAIVTKSLSSKTFAHLFFLVMPLFPYDIKNVLTDNGSEFKKYLDQ